MSAPVRRLVTAVCLALALSLLACAASATDHFLTIGGGDAPSRNQVSLEKNVLYLQRILSDFGISPTLHDIYFSCGKAPSRVVQVHSDREVPKLNRLLADVLGGSDSLDLDYRRPLIPNLRGPATRRSLEDWFDKVGSRLPEGDRLVVYFTGHGGQGRPARNTTLTLWNERDMAVKEFVGLLDKLPPRLQVVLVMVQCHAGGFADVIFKNAQAGNTADALSDSRRCGFFATVPERAAAGCTSDIDEENYHEYSTYFFEAICGRSRTGDAVEPPDFDGDGKVSFAEANAYVQVHSDTIDVPVTTSEVMLRAYSKTRMDGVDDLLTADAPFDRLLSAATPAQRAVLVGLSGQLGVAGADRVDAVRREAGRLQKEKERADQDSRRADRESNRLRNQVASAVRARWPELATAWHPRVQAILRDDADEIVRMIESHPSYRSFEQGRQRAGELDAQSLEKDRRWAKCQRFLRVVNDVALAANLPKLAGRDVRRRYEALVADEGGTLSRRVGQRE